MYIEHIYTSSALERVFRPMGYVACRVLDQLDTVESQVEVSQGKVVATDPKSSERAVELGVFRAVSVKVERA